MEQENTKYLKLIRFCGEELYPIEKATWHYYKNDNLNRNELWLEIQTDHGHQLSEDTKTLNAKPHWELTVRLENLTQSDLKAGFKAQIKNGYDENIHYCTTNFYYCEHEQTDDNHIEIIKDQGDRLLFKVTGKVTDVNYYDGSKPKNKILVETWFDKD